jgi:SAM-dependent methyltransferase
VVSIDWEGIYEDLPTGYQTPTPDRDRIDMVGGPGAGTYGEVTAASARRVLRWLAPTAGDVLLDLGSGTGRFLVQAACETAIGRVVGIEMSPHRHAVAQLARRRLARLDPATAERIEARCEDFTTADWPATTTIAWAGATCFPDRLIAILARRSLTLPTLRHLIATREIPAPSRTGWQEAGRLELEMSWIDRVSVHVYAPDRRAGA